MAKPSLVIVLAEDARHQSLIRRYLSRAGFDRHQIRLVELPSGRGCGEQWVRTQYAKQVKEFRRRGASASTALVIAIDADTYTPEQRSAQLRTALEQAALEPRGAGERIGHLIPKRNVETWILGLAGENVDEVSDYKSRAGVEQLIQRSAETLFTWSRANTGAPMNCVPSLRVALSEIRRVDAPAN